MIFSTSLPRFKTFLGPCAVKRTDLTSCLLLVTPFLLPLARRSVAAAARSLLGDIRNAGWLLRWLGSSSAPAALLAAAQQQLLVAARYAPDRLHVLILDSTQHGQQGPHTENTFCRGNTHKRPKQPPPKKRNASKQRHVSTARLLKEIQSG